MAIVAIGLACLAAILYDELHASETTARYVPIYWLLSAYDSDQSRAAELYTGKRVATRGTVETINMDGEQAFLRLTTKPEPPIHLQGFFTPSEAVTLAALSEGDAIKVECTIGKPGEVLLAHDCSLQQAD
ncbi:OB-fold protein [Pseudomonas sp.]|uniref:OB-fold protein n=1 Tax=Pseudomonas sp. TaxID=306 RepID=UPI003D6F5288